MERQTPSGGLRQFLDPLNPGDYFDHGPARLYGIDEVLELEARRRGRRLGEDEFQLVATDGGLIFCRASICFAIAARWRDLALHRPGKRPDESGRVDLPVDWPTHGQLTFTVSPRLGSNIYRRWLHLREQDDKRAQVAGENGLEVARNTDPNNPVTVVLDEDTKLAIMGELAPDDAEESFLNDSVIDDGALSDVLDETAADGLPSVAKTDDGAVADLNEPVRGDEASQLDLTRMATEVADSTLLPRPVRWTEPGLELTGGETLFVVPERGDVDGRSATSALSTIDPNGLNLQLDAAFRPDPSIPADDHPTDLMPSVDRADVAGDPGAAVDDIRVDGVEGAEDLGADLEPDGEDADGLESDGQEPERHEIDGEFADDLVTSVDPNQTIRQEIDREQVDVGDLLHFDDEDCSAAPLADDDAVEDSVFAVQTPAVPAPASVATGGRGRAKSATHSGPGVRDADTAIGSYKRPDGPDLPSLPRSIGSKPFAGGIGTSVDGDTTLAEIWHRNKVSILAGVSLIVLLVVALSSLLNRGRDGGDVEAGSDSDITIPERSGSISLPTEDPLASTSTTQPRAPLVIEGLTTIGDGVEADSGAAEADEATSTVDPNAGADGQSGDVAICHSNYGGCVPVAADVDCVGDGDGPAFLSEAVVVFGEDVYDLDTDDDREACELGQPLSTPPDG